MCYCSIRRMREIFDTQSRTIDGNFEKSKYNIDLLVFFSTEVVEGATLSSLLSCLLSSLRTMCVLLHSVVVVRNYSFPIRYMKLLFWHPGSQQTDSFCRELTKHVCYTSFSYFCYKRKGDPSWEQTTTRANEPKY